MAEGARQAQPERSRELGVIQVDPDRLPTARTGSPSGVARMIHPPQVRPEEPIAVTPHDGICGGESQQWLSYPTNPHVRFDERGRETGCCRMAQATAPVLDSTMDRHAACSVCRIWQLHQQLTLTDKPHHGGYSG